MPISISRGNRVRFKYRKKKNMEKIKYTENMLNAVKSDLEKSVLKDMRMIGLEPVWQYQIGRYIADFAFPEKKICVEVDGWGHFCFEDSKEHDNIRDEYLRKLGWIIIHVDMYHGEGYKNTLNLVKVLNESRTSIIERKTKHGIYKGLN